MKEIKYNEDGTVTIDGENYKKVEKVINAPSEPLHPTIDEIYDSVKPVYWVDSDGTIRVSSYYINNKCQDSVATQKDAEYILATMQLINIANYYNAKYSSEKKNHRFYANAFNREVFIAESLADLKYGEILFTPSAAKEALSNPNVVEVLNNYFRIK